MKKTFIFSIISIAFVCLTYAQEENKDFELSYGNLTVNHVTNELFDSINKINNKENLEVVLGKEASQEDFDEVCSGMPWIKVLKVAWNNDKINNIRSVSNLKSLQEIQLKSLKASEETPIDLAPLSKLTGLTKIDFYGTKVTDTDALKTLVNLKDVSFYMSAVSSIDFLEFTPDVESLSLYGFKHTFKNYEPVAKLKNLQKLNIYMNDQATDENLKVLKSLTQLKEIRMSNNKQVTSLDFLENCMHMEKISAMWCPELRDFSALKNMKDLISLEIADTKLENLDMIDENCELNTLNISGTKVTDISPLSPCKDLSYIDISKTAISDISPLYNCDKIWSISLNANVPEKQIKKLKTLYPDIRIKNNK